MEASRLLRHSVGDRSAAQEVFHNLRQNPSLPSFVKSSLSGLRAWLRQRYCIPQFAAANSIGVPLLEPHGENLRAQGARRLFTVNSLPKRTSPPGEFRFDRQVSNQRCDLPHGARWPRRRSTFQQENCCHPFRRCCPGLPVRRQTGLDCQPSTPPGLGPRSHADFDRLSTWDTLPHYGF